MISLISEIDTHHKLPYHSLVLFRVMLVVLFVPIPAKLKTFVLSLLFIGSLIRFLFRRFKRADVIRFIQSMRFDPANQQRIQNKLLDMFDSGNGFYHRVSNTIGMTRVKSLVFVSVVTVWLCFGFFIVKLNEESVVLRFGCLNRVCKPGLNWRLPWPCEKEQLVDVTTLHKITVTTNNQDTDTLVLTNDENMLSVQFTIFWKVKDIKNYLFKAKSPDEIVESAAETVMRQIMSNKKAQEALTSGRQDIANQIKYSLQTLLDEYMIGIEIVDAQIGKIDPPETVINAYREVLKAKLEGETKKNEAESYASYVVPHAEGEAYQIISQARSLEAQVLGNAQGDRDAYLAVLSAHEAQPELTKQIMYTSVMRSLLQRSENLHILDQNVPILLTQGGLNNKTIQPGS